MTTELTKAQSDYQEIKYNYDQWLDTLTSDQYVSDDSQTTRLSSSLYTINPEIKTAIESSDIRQEYLEGNQQLLQRYKTVLDRGNDGLNLDAATYQQSREYIDKMLVMTDQALDNHRLLSYDPETEDQAP